MNQIILCEDLVHIYQNKKENVVLNGISFEIIENEKIAIMGKSGSGKSTLLKIIGSLLIPTGGKIYVDGFNLRNLSLEEILTYRRKTVGFLFQKDNLIEFLTIRENIELPMRFINIEVNERKKRINEITKKLDIYRYLDSYPDELSGGENQRAGLAVALANYPKIILADEPTGNLDMESAKNVYKFLVDLTHDFHSTLIMVTHDTEVINYVDRVININDLKKR
jgi:putative ABC transport system ATP-binding protein